MTVTLSGTTFTSASPLMLIVFADVFGDFVYVDGGFRYLGGDVMRAPSTAPRLRIRLGPGGDGLKVVKKVDPAYPPEAMANGIQVRVKLHVVLAADGSVMKQDVTSGDPVLAQAAQDAVKQWKYQPTLLNDEPVEVDTEIEVIFSLKRSEQASAPA